MSFIPRILLLLIEHGARVSQRNKLGLTAFHIAAGNGNSEALEVSYVFSYTSPWQLEIHWLTAPVKFSRNSVEVSLSH
jgi:ankyrin repeat protein